MTVEELKKELEGKPDWYKVGIRTSNKKILPVELATENNMAHSVVLDSKAISDFGESACSCSEDCMHFDKR